MAGVDNTVGTTHRVGVSRAQGLIPTDTGPCVTHTASSTVTVRFTGGWNNKIIQSASNII